MRSRSINNNLWAVDRCEADDCIPVIELGPDGKTLKNFGAGLFVEPPAIDKDGHLGRRCRRRA
jgi:hypothetical protein